MHPSRKRQWRAATVFAVVSGVLATMLACPAEVGAQQISTRRYGVREGLASNRVNSIYQDSKGYLWLGTWDGLSRFDGYRFINYGQSDGLEQPFIKSVVEDRHGRIWVSTWGSGVARLADNSQENLSFPHDNPVTAARQKFVTYRVGETRVGNEVSAMLLDRDNALWCVTGEGVFRTQSIDKGTPRFEIVFPEKMDAALADSQGRLWFINRKGLIEVTHDKISRHQLTGGSVSFPVVNIVEGGGARLLIAGAEGVTEFVPPANTRTDGAGGGEWRRLPISIAPGDRMRAATLDSKGALWLGTSNKLIKYAEGRQTVYANPQLSNNAPIIALHEDREGNLWIGTAEGNTGTGLICKFPGEMIVSFTEADGLPTAFVAKVVESRDGHIYASTRDQGMVEIVDGKVVPVPGSQNPPFHDVGKGFLQDARGDWWVGTSVGLYRFAGPALQFRQGKKFTAADGIPEVKVSFGGTGMHEDAQGKLWVSTGDDLYVYDPGRGDKASFERISVRDISSGIISGVLAMHGDASGALWLASYSGLARMSKGKIETFRTSEGLPDLQARTFYQDTRGRLWIGLRYKGVSVTDDPTAQAPQFRNYSTANGLSSDAVASITEDDFGFLYLGARNQLDPATGRIRWFSTADGLAGDEFLHCSRDRHGNIWMAAIGGVSKLNPRVERELDKLPPPIYLSRIQVAGEDLPLPETGRVSLPALSLSASQHNLSIEYIGLSFRAGRQLRYQYKLEGVDTDWSAPADQRALNFARLAPGSYRFLVRAVDQYGVTSVEPARFEFRIAPPVWQRWWFVASMLALAAVAAYMLYRYRVARLVELERVRTRIATDLHDDIGSNLSRIAILSEVATRQIKTGDERVKQPLSTIATTARELVDSMSDIVWAINPAKDQLSDLTQRMRRFASDVFTARDIEFSFRAPGAESSIGVGVEVRRQVFLIFKEAVNNAVRHAGCTAVDIELRIERGRLELTLRENGRGFDAAGAGGGHGLASMKARAESIGGALHIGPNDGAGTVVILRAPLTAELKRGPGRIR